MVGGWTGWWVVGRVGGRREIMVGGGEILWEVRQDGDWWGNLMRGGKG
jgi:hypothetical protein